jgi:hypothetical protein
MVGVWLAEGYLAAGRPAEAVALAEPAARLAQEQKERGSEATALLLLGTIAARADAPDPVAAEARYTEARTLAEALGMRPLAARCALALGLLHHAAGRPGPARRALAAAAEACRVLGMKAEADQAGRLLGDL